MSKTTLRRGSRSCGISTTISTIVFSPWYGGKKHQQHGCSWSLFGVIVVFRKDVTSSLPALLRFYLCRRGAKGRPDTWACERCGMFFPQGDTVHGSDIRRENHRWDGAFYPVNHGRKNCEPQLVIARSSASTSTGIHGEVSISASA